MDSDTDTTVAAGDVGGTDPSPAAPAPSPSPAPAPSTGSSSPAPTSGEGGQAGGATGTDGASPKPVPSFREVIERALNDGEQPSSPEEQEPSDPTAAKETTTGQPATAVDGQGRDTATPADEPLDEPTEEEMARWRPSTKKRFQQLSRRVKELAPQAEAYRQIDTYLREAQLAPKEVVELFEAGRLLKAGDFDGFLKVVQPHIDVVRQHRGELLPQDIQERLDSGFIDETSAKELARARLTEGQNRQRDEEARQASIRQTAATVRGAVESWEATIRQRDPDYAHKTELMNDRLRVLMSLEGVPTTPEAAVALTRRAYTDVTKTLAQMRPQGRPTSPTPSSTGAPAQAASPRPRSSREAMFAVM
jgi:hypothetical protein